MFLKNKTILIISPQSWGTMFLSKHHYALELARQGNLVYFLNPPETRPSRSGKVRVENSAEHDNLRLIFHSLSFPYDLKFRFTRLFHFLMRRHVRKLLHVVESLPEGMHRPIDIVWSFDLGWLYPFSMFHHSSLKIFHPVDEPLNNTAIRSAEGADILFSVTREILEKYAGYPVPKHFINHGIAASFLEPANRLEPAPGPIHVGFSGNLLRRDIDRPILLEIIREHSGVIFDCFGSYQPAHSNIGGDDDADTVAFIKELQACPNVVLHGVVPSAGLAGMYRTIDAWLICYDVQRDQSRGTNYHKVMEYISTGKVIVSNNITTYQRDPELVVMVDSREDNRALPAVFRDVIHRLDEYNSAVLQEKRIAFAKSNTYARQLERIDGHLSALRTKNSSISTCVE